MRMMKRGVAKAILITAVVLSAFSIAGAIATEGKDGGNPLCPTASACPLQ
jgi:hypothetical protein